MSSSFFARISTIVDLNGHIAIGPAEVMLVQYLISELESSVTRQYPVQARLSMKFPSQSLPSAYIYNPIYLLGRGDRSSSDRTQVSFLRQPEHLMEEI